MIQDEPGEAYLFCVALLITTGVHTTYDNIFFSFLITALGFRLIQLKDLLCNCDFVFVKKPKKNMMYQCKYINVPLSSDTKTNFHQKSEPTFPSELPWSIPWNETPDVR